MGGAKPWPRPRHSGCSLQCNLLSRSLPRSVTRDTLAEIDPGPDQVTVVIGLSLYDMTPLVTLEDAEGTGMASPYTISTSWNMVADSAPESYVEDLERLRKKGIQP